MQRSALCRSRRELSDEYLLAKIGVDTAENENLEVWGKIQLNIHLPPRLLRAGDEGHRWAAAAMAARSSGERANFTRLVLGCIEAKFASKYSLESSRRDLHNALLCTVLYSQMFVKNC